MSPKCDTVYYKKQVQNSVIQYGKRCNIVQYSIKNCEKCEGAFIITDIINNYQKFIV